VALAKPVDSGSVGAPKPAFPLQPGTDKYKVNLQMGAQSMALESSSEVKEEGGHWMITDTANTPMGEAKDSSVLEKRHALPSEAQRESGAGVNSGRV